MVDVSQIVNSEEKLFSSKLNACFFDETHIDVHRYYPKGSLIWQVYHKKVDPANICFLVGAKSMETLDKRLFFFPTFFSFTLQFLASFRRKDMFLFAERPLLQMNLGFYLSKGINKPLRKAVDDYWAVPLLEHGYLMKMFDLCAFQISQDFPTSHQIFTSVKDFTDANSFISDLKYDKFKAFVYLHILLLSLLSAVQAVFLCAKFSLRNYRFRISKFRV